MEGTAMDFWSVVLSSVGGSVALNLALAFLLREIISSRLKRAIDHEYKIKEALMKAELDGKLHAAEAATERLLDEHKTRFSKLHAARANAIKQLYRSLITLEEEVGAAIRPFRSAGTTAADEEKQRHAASVAYSNFSRLFTKNRIYFTEHDCGLIEKLRDQAKKAYIDYTTYDVLPDETMDVKERIEERKLQAEAYKAMVESFPKLRQELEKEFRKTLGFE